MILELICHGMAVTLLVVPTQSNASHGQVVVERG